MTTTITYKGWITVAPPRRNRDATVILAPNRFFYRPKKHVIAEKICTDAHRYGSWINIRIWTYYKKIDKCSDHLSHSIIGQVAAEYSELSRSEAGYTHTNQHIRMGHMDLLEELANYFHHYCIIEVTYNPTEYDMISHEMELILLRNSIY